MYGLPYALAGAQIDILLGGGGGQGGNISSKARNFFFAPLNNFEKCVLYSNNKKTNLTNSGSGFMNR